MLTESDEQNMNLGSAGTHWNTHLDTLIQRALSCRQYQNRPEYLWQTCCSWWRRFIHSSSISRMRPLSVFRNRAFLLIAGPTVSDAAKINPHKTAKSSTLRRSWQGRPPKAEIRSILARIVSQTKRYKNWDADCAAKRNLWVNQRVHIWFPE